MNKISVDPFPVLETERLLLEELTLDHTDVIFSLRSSEEVNRYINRPKATENRDAEAWIKKVRSGFPKAANITWVIRLKASDECVGSLVLWNFQSANYRAEIGYELLPDHQGVGIMSEAVNAVLNFCFDSLNLHTIEANLSPENKASVDLLARNGFRREASFKEIDFYDGQFLDRDVYTCFQNSR